jgi:hypothetical protein
VHVELEAIKDQNQYYYGHAKTALLLRPGVSKLRNRHI